MPPPDTSDLQVILYRLGQLEALPKTVYEIRDAVRDLSVEMRTTRSTPCPAPGKCLELEADLEKLRAEIIEAKAAARAAGWIAKAVGGLVAFAIAAISLYRLLSGQG